MSFSLYSFATEKMFILRKSHLKVNREFYNKYHGVLNYRPTQHATGGKNWRPNYKDIIALLFNNFRLEMQNVKGVKFITTRPVICVAFIFVY